ncbi:MAG: SurA N-terminal domain-containing protein [Candidatus Omnitrophota bacterium]
MLNFLRKKKVQKRILVALAFIIIPAFVLWGVGSMGKKTIAGSRYVGDIDGKAVPIDDFLKARRETEIQLILHFAGNKDMLDKLIEDRALVNGMTWDNLIMLDEARRDNVRVSDGEVVAFITNNPLFVRDGAFDGKFYDYVITQNLGITTRSFEECIRKLLIIAREKENILKNVGVSDDEILEAYRRDNEKGRISYISVDREAFLPEAGTSREDIDKYYREHIDDFTAPERADLVCMKFPYASLMEKEFMMRGVNGIYGEIKKNPGPGKFREIAAENGITVEDIGALPRGTPPDEFKFDAKTYDGIFNMNPGDNAILSDDAAGGYIYLIEIKSKTPKTVKSREDAEPVIRAELGREKSDVLAGQKAEEIYNRISGGGISMEDAARTYGLKRQETDFITRFDYLEGVGEAVLILDKVMTLSPGQSNGPFKTRKGYIIARLDEFKAIDTEKFSREKENYSAKVLSIKKMKALKDWFAVISSKARLAIDLKRI